MFKINDNFRNLTESYLFSQVGRLIAEYKQAHPDADIIRMGIGDVTLPLCDAAVQALIQASREQAKPETFVGYGPEQGHSFLIDCIIEHDYLSRGIAIERDEVFVSDGAKSDIGNIGDLLSVDNIVAITDPVYPVYLDTNIMAGRPIILLPCVAENDFAPSLPSESETPDVIYLCYPNNPTGVSLTRSQLTEWVEYARKNGLLILFDSAYEAYISHPDVPHSIYEIEGARECAIEFRSFSKTAGFTGLRCGYTVVPKELVSTDGVMLNKLWRRRQCTKFNGASYVVQRAAAALYTPEGRRQVRESIEYYKTNAATLLKGVREAGLIAYGGVDSPYVWIKAPDGMTSWDFFNTLLDRCHIAGTPGVGFGEAGEGYLRLTAFNTIENTIEASRRLKLLNIK